MAGREAEEEESRALRPRGGLPRVTGWLAALRVDSRRSVSGLAGGAAGRGGEGGQQARRASPAAPPRHGLHGEAAGRKSAAGRHGAAERGDRGKPEPAVAHGERGRGSAGWRAGGEEEEEEEAALHRGQAGRRAGCPAAGPWTGRTAGGSSTSVGAPQRREGAPGYIQADLSALGWGHPV